MEVWVIGLILGWIFLCFFEGLWEGKRQLEGKFVSFWSNVTVPSRAVPPQRVLWRR